MWDVTLSAPSFIPNPKSEILIIMIDFGFATATCNTTSIQDRTNRKKIKSSTNEKITISIKLVVIVRFNNTVLSLVKFH